MEHGEIKYTGTAQGYSSSPLYASLLDTLNNSHVLLKESESELLENTEEERLGKSRQDVKAKEVTESKALVQDEGKVGLRWQLNPFASGSHFSQGVGDIGLGVWLFWAQSNGGFWFWLAVPIVWGASRGSLVLIDYWTS
jgi:hypothetical protein